MGRTPQGLSTDGAHDRGIDWHSISENSCEIWQLKCRDQLNMESFDVAANPTDIRDLPKILD